MIMAGVDEAEEVLQDREGGEKRVRTQKFKIINIYP